MPAGRNNRTCQSAHEVRLNDREEALTGPTAGMAKGYVQANLVILPADEASNFLHFCQANPRPCPLLGVSEPGSFRIPALGDDLDVRRDLPRYRVFRHGTIVDEPTSITSL